MHLGRALVMGALFIFSTTVFSIWAGYRLNVTPSLPLGLYRVSPVRVPLRRGDLVTFDLPVPLRLHHFLSYTKPVAGLPRDRVCVQHGHLRINGVDYGSVLAEAPAHALHEGECSPIEEAHIFVASTYPRSYDSRYFGVVPLTAVQLSTPVLTWKEGP